MKQFEKYGEYKWEFQKGEPDQYDCYFRFNEEMMANLLNCDVQDAESFLAVELRCVDYEEEYNSSGSNTGKMIKPKYELEIWGYDHRTFYTANNLNHIKGIVKKYVGKLAKLIDDKNYSWDTYYQLCLEMEDDEKERKAKELKAWRKADMHKRIMYTFGGIIKSNKEGK
tara:strand:- start:304 stop:810 length:507 start_codon:yes stop_codon:yes gene_type:complete